MFEGRYDMAKKDPGVSFDADTVQIGVLAKKEEPAASAMLDRRHPNGNPSPEMQREFLKSLFDGVAD